MHASNLDRRRAREKRFSFLRSAVHLLLLSALGATPVAAFDLSGSARVWFGPVEREGLENRQLDQRYTFRLFQEVTPYLNLGLALRYNTFRSSFDELPTFDRSTTEPRVEMNYRRETFDAFFSYQDRALRSSFESQDLDVRSWQSRLGWRPRWGPIFSLTYRSDLNVIDPSIAGRETASQTLDFLARYEKRVWSASYTYQLSNIDNRTTDFSLDQQRHQLRVTTAESFWRQRLRFSVDARAIRVEQDESVPEGTSLFDPIPARLGLFAVDTSPAIGTLEASPGLNDGDFETPVEPPIEIGGGNIFRNLGLDLGFTRLIGRLEIGVDQVSGAAVLWEVYTSPDNLNWFPVVGVTSRFDSGFLRYVLDFDETEGRYIKAVNVTPNVSPLVRATEIRALVLTDRLGQQDRESDQYWVDLLLDLNPVERVAMSLFSTFRSDQDLAGSRISRDRQQLAAGARLRIGLAPHLAFRSGFEISDLEERVDPVRRNETQSITAGLEWDPLPTVHVLLSFGNREEMLNGDPINRSESLSLRALTDLLPGLRLISEYRLNDLDDEVSGLVQSSTTWRETLEARPLSNWTLSGSAAWIRYDSSGLSNLTDRTTLAMRSNWAVTPYLSLAGDWNWSRDNLQQTLSQLYLANWSPGDRLSMSLSWRDTTSEGGASTGNQALNASYRLNRWVRMWTVFSRSHSEQVLLPTTETTTVRFGLDLIF